MQRKSKEENERAERQAEIQAAGGEKVETRPPAEVTLLDPELEDEADDSPGKVVEWRRRRDRARTAEDDWCHEVFGG